jgi:CheY-like chemotaxis protein
MKAPSVLVVDDEAPIVGLVRGYLEREGYAVESAMDERSILRIVQMSPNSSSAENAITGDSQR